MAASNPRDKFEGEFNGIQLTKSLSDEEYEFPSIEYQLVSNRDEEVTITIEDRIPDEIELGDIGFHRDFGMEHWEIDGKDFIFEYTLEPKGECRTVYAFMADSIDVSEDALLPPETVKVDPPVEAMPEPKSMAGSGEQSPKATDSEKETQETEETVSGTEPAEPSGVEDGEPASRDDSLLDQFAHELQRGEHSEESLAILEEQFGGGPSNLTSVNARLTQIEEDVTKLRAYTNALEEFLDEDGSGREIIESIESKLADVDGQLQDLHSTTADVEKTLNTVESELHQVDSSTDSLSSELKELKGELAALEKGVDAIDNRVPAYSINERFEEVEDELGSISDFIHSLKSAFE